ncbi:hypothetical protein BSKO_07654 [Bryopsis sp. KO-2023]|nr:hypothetical protein BSKO_07654 [Bryopsis sp. KO-2023]
MADNMDIEEMRKRKRWEVDTEDASPQAKKEKRTEEENGAAPANHAVAAVTNGSEETPKKALEITPEIAPEKAPEKEPANDAANDAANDTAKTDATVAAVAKEEEVVKEEVVKEAGKVFVWGRNDCGQLGLGEDVEEALRPKPLVFEEEVIDVACGGMHAVALLASGKVFSWGVNDEGGLGRNTENEHWEKAEKAIKELSPEQLDSYTPALVAFPEEGVKITSIVAGDSSCFALDSDGRVWGWGTFRNINGVLGFLPAVKIQLVPAKVLDLKKDDKVVKIVGGANHVACFTEKKAVYSWGTAEQGALARFKEGDIADEVKSKEKLLVPGRVAFDEGVEITDIHAGQYATFFATEKEGLLGCGLNNAKQMGLGEKHERNLVFTPEKLPNFGALKTITGGSHHTIALAEEGDVLTCGRTVYGGLGLSDVDITKNESRSLPSRVSELAAGTVKGVAANEAVSGCFLSNGDVFMWGLGSSGHLAAGSDEDDKKTPCKVRRPKAFSGFKVKNMSIGGMHVAVVADK